MLGLKPTAFDDQYFKIGSTVKVTEAKDTHFYGQVISVSDSKLSIVYVTPEACIVTENISVDEFVDEIFIVEVIE